MNIKYSGQIWDTLGQFIKATGFELWAKSPLAHISCHIKTWITSKRRQQNLNRLLHCWQPSSSNSPPLFFAKGFLNSGSVYQLTHKLLMMYVGKQLKMKEFSLVSECMEVLFLCWNQKANNVISRTQHAACPFSKESKCLRELSWLYISLVSV